MVFFNYATMQMAAKIVYYGPGLCGKTTNLHQIYAKTSPQTRGEMVSLETETDRTLFFDLLPLDVGVIGGFKTRLQLYTVPGQVFYNTTRKLVLKGADGIVFVADSQKAMLEANVESLKNLRENLSEAGLNLDEIPVVVQLNKRDLPTALDRESLMQAIDPEGRYEFVDASAVKGEGVFETLKLVSKLTLRSLRKRMMGDESPPPPRRPPTPVFTVHERPLPQEEAQAEAGEELEQRAQSAPEDDGREVSAPEPVPDLPAADTTADEQSVPAGQEAAVDAHPFEEAGFAEEPRQEHAAAVETFDSASAEHEPAEETDVRFEGDEEPAAAGVSAPPAAPEVRHVKVRSTVDIMAELEDLRKQATQSPARGKVDVLSALDALTTASRARRELTRTMSLQIPRAAVDGARKVEVTLSFISEDGATSVVQHEIEIDRPGWDTLKLNIRAEPEATE